MPSIEIIVESSECFLPAVYQTRAKSIDQQLKNGRSIKQLKGRKIRELKSHIRFKLGRNYRLVYFVSQEGYIPMVIVPRQQLEKWIKRR